MRRNLVGLAALAVIATAGVALARQAPVPGYLAREAWPDAAKLLPPPPASGSPQEAAQMAVFQNLRRLKDTPRWALAQNDVPTGPPAMLTDFSCAVGVQLTPTNAPKLLAMIGRAGRDSGAQVASVKDVFKRPRPYLIAKGPICIPETEQLAASPDYPSGHATYGWVIALILAEAAPDRATPILLRGRAFGDSRAVCGVHTQGAVEAGRLNGAALVAAFHGQPQFRADLDEVRQELAELRRSGPAPDAAACAREAELTAKSPY
jgi:acid phosphatase (class A)